MVNNSWSSALTQWHRSIYVLSWLQIDNPDHWTTTTRSAGRRKRRRRRWANIQDGWEGGKRKGTKRCKRLKVEAFESKKKSDHSLKDDSYIFQIKYLKTHFWMCLNVSGYYCQVCLFFGNGMRLKWVDGSRNQKAQRGCSCDSRKKGHKYLLLSLQPYISWRLWSGWLRERALTNGQLDYKQLWCAPLQKRCSLGKWLYA